MSNKRIIWLAGLSGAIAFASVIACSTSSDDGGGTAGSTSTAGKGGTTSTGGATAAGGTTTAGTTATGGATTAGTGGTATAGTTATGGTATAGTGGTATAGTGGTGGTSPNAARCEVYCAADQTKCPTLFGTDYVDLAGCQTACEAMTLGTANETSGNTIECRITHAGYATTDDPEHCGHASKAGTAGCE